MFEFQINNTLLNQIDGLASQDWGIIAVFVCSKNCVKESAFNKECVFVQREINNIDD